MRSELQRAERARTEHLKVLLRHSIFIFLGNIAGSVTLAVGLWTTARQSLLITWLLVMVTFNLTRWLAARRLPTGFIDEAQTRFWEKLFVASVAISGVLWGAAGGLFYVPDQPEHGLFLALLIVGMCSAATSSLSYHRIAYPVFLLPAITPIMLHLIADEKLAANAIGFVIPFYFTLLYLLSREIYRTAHESIIERINSQYQANFDHLTGVANADRHGRLKAEAVSPRKPRGETVDPTCVSARGDTKRASERGVESSRELATERQRACEVVAQCQ